MFAVTTTQQRTVVFKRFEGEVGGAEKRISSSCFWTLSWAVPQPPPPGTTWHHCVSAGPPQPPAPWSPQLYVGPVSSSTLQPEEPLESTKLAVFFLHLKFFRPLWHKPSSLALMGHPCVLCPLGSDPPNVQHSPPPRPLLTFTKTKPHEFP